MDFRERVVRKMGLLGRSGWAAGWAVALLCLLPLVAVRAQEPDAPVAAIQRLNVQVLPEFDDPRVLVIVQGRLAEGVALPQTLTFRVPRDGQMNQMAVINMSDGQPAARPFDLNPDPADPRWAVATYTVDNSHFFFEYYFNPLGAGAEKQFTFTLSALHPIADLLLEVQQPRNASGFTTTPPADRERVDSHGLTMQQFNLGGLAVDEETAVTIQYSKTDPNPSVPRRQESAPAAQSATTSRAPLPDWLIGVLAVVVVGGLAVFFWAYTRRVTRPRRPPHPSPVAVPTAVSASAPAAAPALFCPQCGTPQRPQARFCHNCGQEL